ncbi:hypothetical protein EPA93_31880 [Ktedonosporobacter rubrisoli]|uniref:Uncharacterized protein n=1 Tax=Ktedonosporobacter rubrisoli TaxID=2509675 RepID=A0A4P6JXG0_KTERU|nr:transglycosylase domain-containing protein [Ktedonosporobacter rubrisoli]QBD80324.1 hypothetical protein EPA93_31880 [Ktedonosporobacter rubrisoli]
MSMDDLSRSQQEDTQGRLPAVGKIKGNRHENSGGGPDRQSSSPKQDYRQDQNAIEKKNNETNTKNIDAEQLITADSQRKNEVLKQKNEKDEQSLKDGPGSIVSRPIAASIENRGEVTPGSSVEQSKNSSGDGKEAASRRVYRIGNRITSRGASGSAQQENEQAVEENKKPPLASGFSRSGNQERSSNATSGNGAESQSSSASTSIRGEDERKWANRMGNRVVSRNDGGDGVKVNVNKSAPSKHADNAEDRETQNGNDVETQLLKQDAHKTSSSPLKEGKREQAKIPPLAARDAKEPSHAEISEIETQPVDRRSVVEGARKPKEGEQLAESAGKAESQRPKDKDALIESWRRAARLKAEGQIQDGQQKSKKEEEEEKRAQWEKEPTLFLDPQEVQRQAAEQRAALKAEKLQEEKRKKEEEKRAQLERESTLFLKQQEIQQEATRAEEERSAVSVAVLPAPAEEVPAPLTEQDTRRMRVNRILIRKRRQERVGGFPAWLWKTAVILLVVVVVLLSGGVGAAYAYYQSQLPLLNGMAQHSLFQTTHIYDRNGHLLYQLYDNQIGRGRRTYVNYSDISPLLVKATVAAEDRTFWTNGGVDPYGIARAAVSDLQHHGTLQGASTVTQQLIKKQLFDEQDRTPQQKVEEAMLAAGLTQQYPKWKIMEMYLNTVFYGDLNYGIEAAAQDYFNLQPKCDKHGCKPAVSQLDLAQASMLAGLPQGPSLYNPIYNKDAALNRQLVVLQAMVDTGVITKAQKEQAHKEMADYKFVSYSALQEKQTNAPHFVRYVVDQVLVPLLGAQNLLDGGYNVYTTLDLDLEKKVEQIVYDNLYKAQQDSYLGNFGPLNITNNVNNASAVVINPHTGEILAMDGSANYNDSKPEVQGQYNGALALRQPGSSMKPIVYATAFELGWYPGMIVPDHKTYYPRQLDDGTYYSPPNYDQKYHTDFPMTMRMAIANSYNIPSVDALMYAGVPNVVNMAARLGLSEIASKPLDSFGPTLALGTSEVSLLHLTGAYATFANQGIRAPATSILEITDNQGSPVYKYNEAHPQGQRAVGADVSFMISSILSDNKARYHEFSPGNPLELDRPAAAKTGTTDNFRDNWTIGYTPHIAVGVWAGNSDNSIMNNVVGITGAGYIWHDVMEYASHLYNFPADDFVRPADVHTGSVSAQTGLLPHPGEATVTDWFIDGTMPTIQGDYSYSTPPENDDGGKHNKKHCHGKKCNNNNNNDNNSNNAPVLLPGGGTIVPIEPFGAGDN